jgi:hypothetical protein
MILKPEQYNTIIKYFGLNENIDSKTFKSFVSDLEKMDLDQQSETIKQLQKFVYKKTKEINKRKKEKKSAQLYDKNEVIIEKIKEILKNSILKTIHKKFNLNKYENFKISRTYTNVFGKRSMKVIDSAIEDKRILEMDEVSIILDCENYIKIRIVLEQFYDYKNVKFDLRIINATTWYHLEQSKAKANFGLKEIELRNSSLEEVYQVFEEFKKQLEDINFKIDTLKYNL